MAISLFKRIKSSESLHLSYDTIVMFQAFSDFLIGLHLLVIAGADMYFMETYIIHDIAWRTSGLCHFASTFSIFANLLSMYTLGFLSVSRLNITKNPLTTNIQRTGIIFKFLFIGIIIDILIACILATFTILSGLTQPLPLCVVFGLRGPITTIVSIIFGILQLVAAIFIISVYSWIAILLIKHAKKKKGTCI